MALLLGLMILHPLFQRFLTLLPLEILRPSVFFDNSLQLLTVLRILISLYIFIIPDLLPPSGICEGNPMQAFKLASPFSQEILKLLRLTTCIAP